MEAEDPDDDEVGPAAPLPPPEQRVWRHPSEMAAAASAGSSPRPRVHDLQAAPTVVAPLRPAWQVALAAGVASAAAVVAMVALTGGLGSQVEQSRGRVSTAGMVPVTAGVGLTSVGLDTSSVARRAEPWLARLESGGVVLGSGLVYRRDHLLTTAHLVAEAEELEAVLADGRRVPAELVGLDVDTDVAVLRLDTTGVEPAHLGSAADLRVGEPAVAMCSHMGPVDRPSVVAGSVSGLGRQIQAVAGDAVLHDLIQLDLATALGSSGGVLVDRDGDVVGLTTSARVTTPGTSGRQIGFAIPIDVARDVADDLLSDGRARRARLGIDGTDVALSGATGEGTPGPAGGGALVHAVADEGPADEAGIRAGDVIVGLGADAVSSMSQLVVRLSAHEPGDRVMLVVWRDGSRRTIWAELGERPAPARTG